MSVPRYTGFEIRFGDDDEGGADWTRPPSIRTNGTPKDNAAALAALKLLAELRGTPVRMADPAQAAAPTPPRGHLAPISKASAAWLAAIKPDALPKTHTIKRAAVESFVAHYGEVKPVSGVMREDVSAWIQALRNSGLATPTLANKTGYLTSFLDWCVGQGYCAAFPTEKHNPARGVVLYRKKDKQRRTKETGYKPFSSDDIHRLFAAEALTDLPLDARWGAVLGLYTGARVSEIGQLTLDDFQTLDGIACIRLTDEQPGQSLKTASSHRTIPLHPDLVRLGLLDRVALLSKRGETRLFPAVKVGGVNGMGNWLSKAFARYRLAVGILPPGKGKHGFHSFRSTLIQAFQDKKVPAEIRAAYVGHDLDDDHHGSYSRQVRPREMLEALTAIQWGLKLDDLQPLLTLR